MKKSHLTLTALLTSLCLLISGCSAKPDDVKKQVLSAKEFINDSEFDSPISISVVRDIHYYDPSGSYVDDNDFQSIKLVMNGNDSYYQIITTSYEKYEYTFIYVPEKEPTKEGEAVVPAHISMYANENNTKYFIEDVDISKLESNLYIQEAMYYISELPVAIESSLSFIEKPSLDKDGIKMTTTFETNGIFNKEYVISVHSEQYDKNNYKLGQENKTFTYKDNRLVSTSYKQVEVEGSIREDVTYGYSGTVSAPADADSYIME